MTRPTDETLLAFLEQRLGEPERAALLDALDADPELGRELRRAAVGLETLRELRSGERAGGPVPSTVPIPRRISPWWAVAAAAATLVISVPATLRLASPGEGAVQTASSAEVGPPVAPEPSFVLVLQGTWPDAVGLDPGERRRRAEQYWSWTASLARRGMLVAAGDLRWEPGERLGPRGVPVTVSADVVRDPGYMVGMLALRVDTYEEALEVARGCPHLLYGGTVSVRRVGAGFVTVDGMDDWAG